MMSANWKCRAFQPGDEAGIIDLYRDVFHLQMSPELWRWMYQSPPAGPAIIVVLERDDRLIGHYAVQPREFYFAGRRTNVGFAVGTMVLPELRSVKALVEMAQLAYSSCRERGLPWLYAFPNDVAHKVRCGLLGWKALPQLVEWDGPLPTINRAPSDQIRTWRHFPVELNFDDLLFESNAPSTTSEHQIRSARSAVWLRWRFFDRPGGEYVLHTIDDDGQVTAYAVAKRYTRDGVNYGHILDWRVGSRAEHQSDDLLSSLWKQFHQWEVQRVSCWASGQCGLAKILARSGLTLSGTKNNFCYFDLDGSHGTELSQASAWQVEMADSDVY